MALFRSLADMTRMAGQDLARMPCSRPDLATFVLAQQRALT
jgi:hypothetical protein